MRDYVEIGIGREARRTYDLDDIAVVPARRTRSSKDVDTTWHIDAYTFKVPFMSHPTDALASPEFVIEMDKQGGLGVINAEGLWGRHADLDAAITEIVEAHGEDELDLASLGRATKKLQELHAAELDKDLLTERIAQVRDSGAVVAVRVSPQRCRELAPLLIKAGADLLIIQGTIISAEYVETSGEPLNLKEFIGSIDVPVIAGGVSDYTTALHLMRAGAVGIIAGGGSNTNDLALGIDDSLATAIADVAAARRDYLDETGGRYVHVIADGNINNSGQAVKPSHAAQTQSSLENPSPGPPKLQEKASSGHRLQHIRASHEALWEPLGLFQLRSASASRSFCTGRLQTCSAKKTLLADSSVLWLSAVTRI